MHKDYLSFFFYIDDLDYLNNGLSKYMPIINKFRELGLPEPNKIKYYTKTLKDKIVKISGWYDPKLLEAFEPINRHNTIYLLTIFFNEDSRFEIYVTQQFNSEIGIAVPAFALNTIDTEKIYSIFKAIVLQKNWYLGKVRFRDNTNRLIGEIGMFKKRSSLFGMFSWLQYLSAELIEEEGGFEAFENNPLLKCERIHDGLLVQVGESPYDIFTPEGETLLVKATLSLPPTKRSLTKRLVFPTLNKVLKEYERLKNNNEDMSYYDLYYKKNNITRNLTSKQIEEYFNNKMNTT